MQGDCERWWATARNALLDPASTMEDTALREHLVACPRCRERLGDWVEIDRSLRHALRSLEQRVGAPSRERIDRILADVREPETSRLLRQVRRPVNTMLWVSVLALSVGALATLAAVAWLVYRAFTGESP